MHIVRKPLLRTQKMSKTWGVQFCPMIDPLVCCYNLFIIKYLHVLFFISLTRGDGGIQKVNMPSFRLPGRCTPPTFVPIKTVQGLNLTAGLDQFFKGCILITSGAEQPRSSV